MVAGSQAAQIFRLIVPNPNPNHTRNAHQNQQAVTPVDASPRVFSECSCQSPERPATANRRDLTVFKSRVMREINGVPCAIIGQAFPYSPIANPRYLMADWGFGIQDENMQKVVDEARGQGVQVVVLLSHNRMDVDLKMASRVSGIDAILGGHTHDGVPVARLVANRGGKTIVTNAGSNGKFLGVLDLQVNGGKVADFRYKLLPVFANMLPADKEMNALIAKVRAPYEARLGEKLAINDGLLYRRANFNGTGDQLLLDALMEVQCAEIAFSPGFRWGTTLLPGQAITREWLMDMTAITYPSTTLTEMTGTTPSRQFWKTWPTTCSTPVRITSRAVTWCAWPVCNTVARRMRAWASASTTCASMANRLRLTANTRWRAGHRSLSTQKTPVASPSGTWWRLGSNPKAQSHRANSTRQTLWARRAILCNDDVLRVA